MSRLPSPTSGPSVATYIGLCLLVALVVAFVLSATGNGLGAHIDGLRVALGMRAS